MTKKFTLYESFSSIDHELLERSERSKKPALRWRAWGSAAACLCLLALAALALPGHMPSAQSEIQTPPASPAPSSAIEGEKKNLESDQKLELQEALEVQTLGAYLLQKAPAGYAPEPILWHEDGENSFLSSIWTQGQQGEGQIDWRVSLYRQSVASRVASIDAPQSYDLGLYSFPLCESVPEALMEIVDCPIFQVQELTRQAVASRAYYLGDSENASEMRMRFGVLYGDVLVEVNTKGISADWLYEQLIGLKAEI